MRMMKIVRVLVIPAGRNEALVVGWGSGLVLGGMHD
jgi:hypothetical protein